MITTGDDLIKAILANESNIQRILSVVNKEVIDKNETKTDTLENSGPC